MTADARQAITEAFATLPGKLSIGGSRIEWVSPLPLHEAGEFEAILSRLIKIGSALRPARTEDDLYGVAGTDSNPGVRRELLQFLVEKFPEDPRTAELLREALRDADPIVRELARAASGGAAGQLSIASADDAQGSVSLAGEAGSVSLADAKKRSERKVKTE